MKWCALLLCASAWGQVSYNRIVNAANEPGNWLTYAGMGRIACSQGDYSKATEQMKLALASAPDQGKPSVQSLLKRLAAKEDINK